MPSRARKPRLHGCLLKSGGVALESARRAGIQVSVSSPGGAVSDGGGNYRSASRRILTGRESLSSKGWLWLPEFRKPNIAPCHVLRKLAKAWIPALRARLTIKIRRTSKIPQERSKIRPSDNRARSGRNDGTLENSSEYARSKRIPGLGFDFGHSLTISFQCFALECIPGRFASAFRQAVADLRTTPESRRPKAETPELRKGTKPGGFFNMQNSKFSSPQHPTIRFIFLFR